MLTSTAFHEDIFYAYFRPFRHPSARHDIWGGYGLETFGDDLHLAFNYDNRYVWTVVDGGDSPDQWIIPGFHHINRLCFLLTEVAHLDAPIEFRIELRPRSLTPIGLVRRTATLKKILANHQYDKSYQ